MLDLLTLVAITGALVSCGAAVFSVLFVRRGADADIKNDLAELALLVERMAKTNRREKMARVRAAAKEVPAEEPADFALTGKSAIRARLASIAKERG